MTRDDSLLWGAGIVGALLLFPQLAGFIARKAVAATGTLVTDVATGAVIGIGEAVGVPPTDAEQCQNYLSIGDYWNASLYCPAGTFLKSAGGAIYDTATGAIVGESEPSGVAEVIAVKPLEITAEDFQAWQQATGGVLAPGQTQDDAIRAWIATQPDYGAYL